MKRLVWVLLIVGAVLFSLNAVSAAQSFDCCGSAPQNSDCAAGCAAFSESDSTTTIYLSGNVDLSSTARPAEQGFAGLVKSHLVHLPKTLIVIQSVEKVGHPSVGPPSGLSA